jgi:hypothetical protein
VLLLLFMPDLGVVTAAVAGEPNKTGMAVVTVVVAVGRMLLAPGVGPRLGVVSCCPSHPAGAAAAAPPDFTALPATSAARGRGLLTTAEVEAGARPWCPSYCCVCC